MGELKELLRELRACVCPRGFQGRDHMRHPELVRNCTLYRYYSDIDCTSRIYITYTPTVYL